LNTKYSFICDGANISQRGTLNVLGIFRNIHCPQFPHIHPKMVYVACFDFHRSEVGSHIFKITLVDEDGKNVINAINGKIEVLPVQLYTNIIMEFNGLKIEKAGTYQIDLTVDNHHLCSESIAVAQIPK